MIIRMQDVKLVHPNSPILHVPPAPYDFEKNGATAQLFANVMFEKMKEFKGVGMSANQVGINTTFFVIGVDDIRIDVFNPKVLKATGECNYNEGCLSYPGMTVKVKRPEEIVVEYQNARGEKIQSTLGGLTARIFLHEYDHMQGLTIKDKISSIKWQFAQKKLKKTTSVVNKQQT